MTEPEPADQLHIGDCVLFARRHELHVPGRAPQRLPKRLVELLLALAAQPGQVLGRQQLLDLVWQRRMVADEVLSRAIADLRLALGDDARAPRYIETIPKTGYRLVALLSSDSSDPPGPTQATATPSLQQQSEAPAAANEFALQASRRRAGSRVVLLALVGLGLLGAAAWWIGLPGRSQEVAAAQAQQSLPQTSPQTLQQRVARATPLTSDASWEMHPATSADGVWLAYSRAAPFAAERHIHLRHLLLGTDRVWADEAGINDSPAFSPDGSELVYRHCHSTGAHCQWRRRAAHGGAWQVLAAAHPQAPGADWSDLGIVAVLGEAGAQTPKGLAWLPSAAGQSWIELQPHASDQGIDQLPRWIPGTRAVAVLRSHALQQSLRRVELDTPQQHLPLPLPRHRLYDHRWRAADEVWLSSDQFGFRALLRWRQGSEPELLGARGARGIALLPGAGAVLDVAEYDTNLHQLRLSELGQPATPIEVSTRSEGHPTLSPDGRWLALVSLREGSDQVWLQDLRNGELRRVSSVAPATHAVRPAFSADGRYVYFSVYSDAGIHTWGYDLGQRGARLVLGDEAFAAQPGSLPGEFVYAKHSAEGALQLWYTAGNQPAHAVEDAENVVDFRVDQNQLWWLSADVPDWQRLDLRSGIRDSRSRPAAANGAELWSWTLDAGVLYALFSDGVLYRLDGADHANWRSLGQLAEAGVVHSMAVHAATDRLVLTRTDRIAVDLFQVPASP